jgi:FtsH-binding integral membrane protein
MKDFKSTVRTIGFHGKILAKGFIRMVFGAITAGLLVLAIFGFAAVTSESGWTAVCEFIASTCMVVFALCGLYLQGGSNKKRGGYEK